MVEWGGKVMDKLVEDRKVPRPRVGIQAAEFAGLALDEIGPGLDVHGSLT